MIPIEAIIIFVFVVGLAIGYILTSVRYEMLIRDEYKRRPHSFDTDILADEEIIKRVGG